MVSYKRFSQISFISLLCMLSPLLHATEAVSVDAFLEQAKKTSEDVRAIDLTMQFTQTEIEARELELSPTLRLDVNRFWDDRSVSSSNPQTFGNNANLNLTQPFATGTKLSLLSGVDTQRYQNTPAGDQHLLSWEIGVSQSLWQNSFGRQTTLRRRRDQNELRSRFLLLILQEQQLLIDFESLYWDLSYSQQEVKIRQQNLDRSRKILSWVQDRFQRSAAESTDLLQAKALVSSRELQLQVATDHLKTVEAKIDAQLPMANNLVPNETDIKQERALTVLTSTSSFAPKEPVLIESLLAASDTDLLMAQARLNKDKLKPVLEVGYAYGQQGYDSSFSTAKDEAFSSGNRYHRVGVVLATPLAFSLISKSNRALQMQAEAQGARSARLQRQSHIQWVDLERTVSELKLRIVTATTLAKYQIEKGTAERDRYLKGRTTAFEAISFEQDAAESELLVLQLQSQLRHLESQARLYIYSVDEK